MVQYESQTELEPLFKNFSKLLIQEEKGTLFEHEKLKEVKKFVQTSSSSHFRTEMKSPVMSSILYEMFVAASLTSLMIPTNVT